MLNDSPQRYGLITRFFHWFMAVLVLQQFFKFGDYINDGKHWLGDTFGPYHTSIGALIMLLAVIRLIWGSKQKSQRPRTEGILGKVARASHHTMYTCMLVMPPLGALYIYGKGYPVKLFGMTILDKPAAKTQWMTTVGELHAILAVLLVLLVLAHISGAMYHHFIRKDDTLKRMV
jgi:cytochrome b561